ncbi:hypothetical protein F4778DRAFT_735566 [Xylariomycetidae sp. FL2044]|nr:hypothetical protein F4778DRAFT_735566 [Xylariomycetidae sp. FL2044]
MALLGLSLVLASVVYFAIRRPPFIETLFAILRGHPQIEQPPTTTTTTTRSPPPPSTEPQSRAQRDHDEATATRSGHDAASAPNGSVAKPRAAMKDRAAMPPPPPPPVIRRPDDSATRSPSLADETSPQTTPKASATRPNGGGSAGIPSFSLSADPPASPAAIARTNDRRGSSSTSSTPSLSSPASPAATRSTATPAATTAAAPARGSMLPPPRPPTLNSTTNNTLSPPSSSSSSLSPLPNRSYTRQPGTSTLAPPPTHNTVPAKPSRKVLLTPGHSPLDWARLANSPTSDLRNLPPQTPYLRVTPSMLRRQTGRRGKDAWTALGGRVYNISPYLPFHPGGEPELLRCAGRDGTRLFGEIHPWVNYEGMLASCLIGVLVEEGEEGGGRQQGNGVMDEMD